MGEEHRRLSARRITSSRTCLIWVYGGISDRLTRRNARTCAAIMVLCELRSAQHCMDASLLLTETSISQTGLFHGERYLKLLIMLERRGKGKSGLTQ